MSPVVWMSPAVTTPGPRRFSTRRLTPSPCILTAMSLTLRTMSTTSSRTPGIDENSCSTPSTWIEVIAAPCSDDSSTRRSELPSVWPKPRSSGSATTVATRRGSSPWTTSSFFGLISSCQFFWITGRSPSLRNGVNGAGGSWSRESRQATRPKSAAQAQTRRRLRGRQPLCGIGVTSRIEVTLKPAAWMARSADSRPEPGPETSTSSVRMPCSDGLPAPRPRRPSGRRTASTCASP